MTNISALPPGSIRLTGNYAKNALEKEISYLLSIDEGRLLAGFYENAGIPTRYVRYGGWEDKLIAGHTMGHYLSALAQAYKNGGVGETERAKLLRKLQRICDALLECGEKRGGLVWAAPAVKGGIEAQFDNVERGRTNIRTEAWVPWYTLHKLLAGLIDAYDAAGCASALQAASALGDWVARRALAWDKQTQDAVLAVEYGGMNDCLYELYARTGQARHAQAAHVFDEEALFDRILSEGKDVLKDKHANTTIPKILGALKRYLILDGRELAGEKVDAPRYLRVAEVFFRMVLERHTYATGGNSEWEHFGADYVLDAERTNCNCETCNVYNMLKLARLLFCVTGDKYYTDYYDTAFTNTILSSQNPETGMTTYFQPMAGGFFKVFSRPFDKFWCCTGSGMESFTKLGDSAVYACGTGFYLEQYLPMEVETPQAKFFVEADFPLSDRALIRVERGEVSLKLRVPDWAAGDMDLFKNGAPCPVKEENGHLLAALSAGEELLVRIPVGVRVHPLPDAPDTVAFTYGGAVLSADLGTEDMAETETGVDVTIPARRILASERVYFADAADVLARPGEYLLREGDKFRLVGGDVSFLFGLHYRRYRERYAIYFKLCSGAREAEEERRTPVDVVQPGYGQYETDELHDLREENTVSVTSDGTYRYCRAGGAFSYDFRVLPQKKNTLCVRLLHADNGKPLKVTAGDAVLFDGLLNDTMGEELYRREWTIPQEAIARCAAVKTAGGKQETVLRVRFEGDGSHESARVCEFIEMFAE